MDNNLTEMRESDEKPVNSGTRLEGNEMTLFQCQHCPKKYKKYGSLTKHENGHKKKLTKMKEPKDKDLMCKECGQNFKFPKLLKRHLAMNCKKLSYWCEICIKSFSTMEQKESHQLTEHPVKKAKTRKCRLCPKKFFETEEEYLYHVNEKHKGSVDSGYICSDCGKQFKTKSELTHHINSKCGTIKNYKCKVCHQDLMTAGSLHNHMLRHTGERCCMCGYCGKLFLTVGQLKVHERTHTQEKAFICPVCGKGFCHRQSLITHSTLHTGIKPYQCENCGQAFSCVGNLLKHRRTHADSCGLLPLTSHLVTNATTKLKVKINTPGNSKLKAIRKQKELEEKLAAYRATVITNELEGDDNTNFADVCDEPSLDSSIDGLYEGGHKGELSDINRDIKNQQNVNMSLGTLKYIVEADDLCQENSINVPISVSTNSIELEEVPFRDEEEQADDKDNVEKALKTNIPQEELTIINSTQNDFEKNSITKLCILESAEIFSSDSKILVNCTNTNDDYKSIVKSEEVSLPFAELPEDNKPIENDHDYSNMDVEYGSDNSNAASEPKPAGSEDKKELISIIKCEAETTVEDDTKASIKINKRGGSQKKEKITDKELDEFMEERGICKYKKLKVFCKFCEKFYTNPRWLLRHEREHILKMDEVVKIEDEDSKNTYRCSCCKDGFESKEECKEHQQLKHADLLTCQECEKIFSNVDSLHSHQNSFHKGLPRKIYVYVCEKCGIQFRQKAFLDHHKKNNCGESPNYACPVCGKGFNTMHTRQSHLRIHDPKKQFLCKHCGKNFRWKGQLKIHERSHTGEKPFKCLYCPKAFAYRESLVTHSSLHTGIKPHLCQACGSRFSCIGNLIKHRATHATTCGAWYEKSLKK